MITSVISYSLIIVLGCIIVITMRITLPCIWAFDGQIWFQQMKFNVIKVYVSLTAVIVLEMLLIYLSVSMMYMIADWLSVLYLPLLIYGMHRTYVLCVVHFPTLISAADANSLLLQYFQDNFENDDPKWLDLQAELECCGLQGPQTYMDYLRQVPDVCYRKGVLVTRGCEGIVYDTFHGVHWLSKLLSWLALALQLITFLLYLKLLIMKYIYLICRSIR
ncbi:uncharacterized protein LOC111603887 [Drosophila hydei]|uniref:Uncharacterized protein LOC111603887 n=1 Tax=Drosophila hydei TaxID=7224 RepID=A0A6J1MAN6_DROHY|nr:uncharacterized protein LOC111603887 [Drosophila hydei]